MKKFSFAIILPVLLALQTNAQDVMLKGKEMFGDMTARQIGPALMSGRISDLEGHPTNSRIVYAGTAGGGVGNLPMEVQASAQFLMTIYNQLGL